MRDVPVERKEQAAREDIDGVIDGAIDGAIDNSEAREFITRERGFPRRGSAGLRCSRS